MSDGIKKEVTITDLQLDRLSDITSVVYGAVVSYAFFLLMQDLGALFSQGCGQGIFDRRFWSCLMAVDQGLQLSKVLLLALVTDYMVADFVEARVLTNAVPYEGRGRFACDLLVCMLFLGACEAAHDGSRAVLLALGGAFAVGTVWAVYLRREGNVKYDSIYPACILGTHALAAAVAIGAFFLFDGTFGPMFAFMLWAAYVGWLCIVAAVKVFAEVAEPSGFNMLPVSLCAFAAQRAAKAIRDRWKRLG